MIDSRIPTEHKQVSFTQGAVMRAPSPYFAPPVLAGMREPGTNYFTIITAPDPHTTEVPYGGPGTAVGPGSNVKRTQYAMPLTHKGG